MAEALGRYEILEEIGQGGFAIVYRAQDTELNRQVALKELRPTLLQDTEGIKRFKREARTIAGLDHHRVVTIYDVLELENRLFIVMRLVDGPSLDEVIAEQGRLPWSETLDILSALAEGLDAAHGQGILHRDLKPANILMDRERGPLLTDFGLAKLADEGGTSITATGGVVGSPHYIAPEVWDGQGSSVQSDIYALGCILYEMLTAEKVVQGATPPAIMMGHFEPLALPENWPEDVPSSVTEVFQTALAKAPADRYGSAGEMVVALSGLLTASDLSASPPLDLQAAPPKPEAQIFVARESELAQLNDFLEQAIAGQGSVVFVTGEAGAGKTTLVTEFVRQAQQKNSELLFVVGNCNAQTGRGDPYLPFREILGLLTGDVEDKLAQGAISPEAAQRLQKFFKVSGEALVKLGPMLINTLLPGAGLVSRVGVFAADKLGWLDKLKTLTKTQAKEQPDLSQEHIFEQYTAVLQALAAKRPLLLWLDDLHWVDPASADLLFHLGRALERSRILVLGTYRQEEIALGRGTEPHPLANVVSEFKRYWGDIQIDLDQARINEGRRFVDALLDTEPNRLEETFRQAMYRHTGGHPLFTVELLRDLQERAELVLDDTDHWVATPTLDWGALPARVEGVIEKRIRRLDVDLQEALTTASVEGEQFTVEVVAQVQGVAARELVRRLSREVDKQHRLVQARGSQHLGGQRLSRYQFRHNLIQKYLYNSLDEVERAYLHEEVGHTLEELCGEQAEALEAHLGALAYHFYEAALWPKALEYAQRAGEKALTLFAPQAAIEQFGRALEAADQQSLKPPPRLYHLRGQAFDTLGNFDRARADYEAAQEAARAAGDQRLTWQTLLDLGLLWASRDYDKTGDYCRQALGLARSMADQAAIGHSLNRLGNWLMNSGQPFEALEYHREALDIFETLDDRPGIAATLDLLAMTSQMAGVRKEMVTYYQQAIPILRELNDRHTLSSSLTNLALVTMDEAPAREAIKLAQEIDWRAGEAYALGNLGYLIAFRGDYEKALKAGKNALELAQAIEHRLWQASANLILGQIYLDLLALEQAQRHLERSLDIAREVGSSFFTTYAAGTLASVYIEQHRLDEAAALLPEPPFKPVMSIDYIWVKPAAELALVRQDGLQALQIVDEIDLPGRSNWLGTFAYFLGATVQLRGEALTMLGRLDEAENALQDVTELYQEQGIRRSLWRIQLALGKLYQAAEKFDQAETAFATARTMVEELAATVTDDTLRENFRQQAIGLIPPSKPLRPR